MLHFCSDLGLGAKAEPIAGSKINDAYERARASDVHYRIVIDTSTLS
ncbi:hypothetical protein [Arthrobacter sp. 2RAF22]